MSPRVAARAEFDKRHKIGDKEGENVNAGQMERRAKERPMEWLSSVWLFIIGTARNPWHQKTANRILSFHPCQVWHVCSFIFLPQRARVRIRQHATVFIHSSAPSLAPSIAFTVSCSQISHSVACDTQTGADTHTRPRWRTHTHTQTRTYPAGQDSVSTFEIEGSYK